MHSNMTSVHEGGAIEYSGHKVITIPSKEGKVSASDVETYMEILI
jgi:threonine aldolase